MKYLKPIGSYLLLGLALLAGGNRAGAQNTTFTYQGRVQDNGTNYSGSGRFQFALITTNATATNTWWSNDGTSVGGSEPAGAGVVVNVTNSQFAVALGSSAVSNMAPLATTVFLQPGLQLAVWFSDGVNGFGVFPLQPLTPAPYATYAAVAGSLVNPAVSLTTSNLTMTGSLTLPGTTTINAGGNTLLHVDGNFNFFAGQNAGNSTNSGQNNVALGQNALSSIANGQGNTALGVGTLGLDTAGAANSAGGYGALGLNNTGNYNTAFGTSALADNTTGTNNVAVGFDALSQNGSGNNNVAVGSGAALNTTGTNNVGLGFLAGYNVTSGNNNIEIGSQGVSNDSGVIRIGTPGTQTQTYIAGVINGNGSGLTLPAAAVTNGEAQVNLGALVVNTITMTGVLATALPAQFTAQDARYLGVDGSANAYFGLAAGGANAGGSDNVGVGQNALALNPAGSANVAIGMDALGNTTNDNKVVAVGYQALQNDNAGGNGGTSGNTAVGYQALAADTSGFANTAIGYQALSLNRTGIGNIAIGDAAGSNLTNSYNIDIGNPGTSSDMDVIRIGNGQSTTYIAGVIQSPSVTSITITGGSDLAEPFAIASAGQTVSAGEVVVIDAANPGRLKLTDQPYDTRVAGVISGANGIHPGIQMHQEGVLEGGRNVALSGRVYVQADTSNGAIQPGDLLTTSSTPGSAMRVSDHAKAQGAILGKAMTSLQAGKGMVLVLVTLQ